MSNQSLHIVHLYPKEMNIYGDTGNRLIMQKRLEWRGIDAKVSLVGIGDAIPEDADIILGGGGQDAGQIAVQNDLLTKADTLRKMADHGVVMLMVCGLYQLFGRRFLTHDGTNIQGISILPVETIAGKERLIGNTIIHTEWGDMPGYENHSGQTTLDDSARPLGQMLSGAGNNSHDKTEGCIYENVFGTYAHGPILSKNPEFADELLGRALRRKYGNSELAPLDDTMENMAAEIAKTRPR